jgi:hypothetical protein
LKKLLIVLLVVAMTLSLTAIAFGATVNTYMGGRWYFTWRSNNNGVTNVDLNKASASESQWDNRTMITMNWSVKAESGNSWAKLQWLCEVWSAPNTGNFTYSIGQNNIADMIDWQFNTGNASTTLIGQNSIVGIDTLGPYDPMFFNRPKQIIAIGIHTDALKINLEASPNDLDGDGNKMWVAALTYKMDAGDVHVGITGETDIVNGASYIVGTKLKFEGLGTFVADYYSATGTTGTPAVLNGWSSNQLQAGLSLVEMKMKFVVAFVMPNSSDANLNFFGLQAGYTGIDKISLNVKYFSDDAYGNKHGYELFGTYNVGAFSLRLGYEVPNDPTNAYFCLGAFGQIW